MIAFRADPPSHRLTWQRDGLAVACLIALVVAFCWQLVFTDLILPRGDAFTYFYPYWAYRNDMLRAGQIPLWNPYLFMGAPFLANSQAGVLYPFNWPLIGLDAPTAVKVAVVAHLALAAVGAYVFARRALSLSVLASALTGIVFGLGGYLTAQIEHVNQLQGLAWLPWAFWLWCEASNRRDWKAALGLGLTLAMQLLAGHTQTVFITGIGLGVFATWRAIQPLSGIWLKIKNLLRKKSATLDPDPIDLSEITAALPDDTPSSLSLTGEKERGGKGASALLRLSWAFAPIVIGAIAALALSAAQLLPTLELAGLSLRSDGLPFIEALSFSLRPTLIGRAFLPQYGPVSLFTEYVAYVGVIGLMLALLGAWHARRDQRLSGLLVLIGVGLFLALGAYNPIYWLLVKIVPGFRLFRAPARWLALWAFGVSGLAGAGLDNLIARKKEARGVRHLWPGLVVSFLIALSFLAALATPEVIGASAPSGLEVAIWAMTTIVAVGLVLWNASAGESNRRRLSMVMSALVAIELFSASRALPFNRLSAPSAWSSQRPTISALLAAGKDQIVPDRFLSLSDIRFDPGDLREIEAAYQPYLDPNQLYDYVIAVKQKEVISPNLPLYWRVPAMDGFDGGVLPTRAYAEFTSLFLDEGKLSPDGRLRENLKAVPDLAWLRIANVRWIVTDKVYDVWVDGVYYDLQFPARRQASQAAPSLPIEAYPDRPFVASQVGIIGHIEGVAQLPDGSQVGSVSIYPVGAASSQDAITLPLIVDASTPGAFQSIDYDPPIQAGFFTIGNPELPDYRIIVGWNEPRSIDHVEIQIVSSFSGTLIIRGMTLIDQRGPVFTPMTLSSGNVLRLANSGDVKLYEYRGALPRAYVVCNATMVGSPVEAAEALRRLPVTGATVIERAAPTRDLSCGSGEPGSANVTDYQPDLVTIQTMAKGGNSYLILSDAWYPGWSATIDGSPTPIYRANGMFRAIELPDGSHKVEFTYRSQPFEIGAVVSIFAWIVVCAGLAIRWPKRLN